MYIYGSLKVCTVGMISTIDLKKALKEEGSNNHNVMLCYVHYDRQTIKELKSCSLVPFTGRFFIIIYYFKKEEKRRQIQKGPTFFRQ